MQKTVKEKEKKKKKEQLGSENSGDR